MHSLSSRTTEMPRWWLNTSGRDIQYHLGSLALIVISESVQMIKGPWIAQPHFKSRSSKHGFLHKLSTVGIMRYKIWHGSWSGSEVRVYSIIRILTTHRLGTTINDIPMTLNCLVKKKLSVSWFSVILNLEQSVRYVWDESLKMVKIIFLSKLNQSNPMT